MSHRSQKESRAILLARREKTTLPYRENNSGIKAMRNHLYLSSKGVISAVTPSERVAVALTNDNAARHDRREALQFDRASKAAIQAGANDKWLSPALPLSNRRLRKMGLGL